MRLFELADKSKPGYREILILYLVDPHIQIISTAHAPPLQEDWATEKKALIDHILGTRLPLELKRMVEKELDLGELMIMDEARQYRRELIKERESQATLIQISIFERGDFAFEVRTGLVSTIALRMRTLSTVYLSIRKN